MYKVLLFGLCSVGCVQQYFVRETAITGARRAETETWERRIAVVAVRASDRGSPFVRFDELQIDGPAAAGGVRAHTRAILGPAFGAPLVAASVGFSVGAIVLDRIRSPDLDGLGDWIGEVACIITAIGTGIAGIALWAALGNRRALEVEPGKRGYVYVASDGSVHF
jgi:hypothetical protein